MLKALERNVDSAEGRLVFVAPSPAAAAEVSANVEVDDGRYQQIIRDVQQFRGTIYLKDGAVDRNQLTPDGLHKTDEDNTSWHMLLLDKDDRVGACALYREHENTVEFDDLRVRQCPLAHEAEWGPTLWKALDSELQQARRDGLKFAELGGWAVAEESRGTAGPLTLAFAVYGFSRRAGGALGMTTATFRHCSSTILKRLGGARFEVDGTALPPYYDPRYKCMMEILRFDSRRPNPRYIDLIDRLRAKLSQVLVIAPPAQADAGALDGFWVPGQRPSRVRAA